MRNKIYKPYKGWIAIGFCWALCAIAFYLATTETAKSDRIFCIFWGVILFIITCICTPIIALQFFVVYDDKIIFRRGKRNSRYTPFKIYTLSIKEIVDIQLEDVRPRLFMVITYTHITLSDGQKYTFTIEGYSDKDEIKRLMYDVQEQIKATKR